MAQGMRVVVIPGMRDKVVLEGNKKLPESWKLQRPKISPIIRKGGALLHLLFFCFDEYGLYPIDLCFCFEEF
jgi:hypothetical protein